MYSPSTLLKIRNRTETAVFVVRLKVKQGNPADLYHIISSKDTPEAYQDLSKPLSFIDYVSTLSEKMRNEANGSLQVKEPHGHPLCVHNLKFVRSVGDWSTVY